MKEEKKKQVHKNIGKTFELVMSVFRIPMKKVTMLLTHFSCINPNNKHNINKFNN